MNYLRKIGRFVFSDKYLLLVLCLGILFNGFVHWEELKNRYAVYPDVAFLYGGLQNIADEDSYFGLGLKEFYLEHRTQNRFIFFGYLCTYGLKWLIGLLLKFFNIRQIAFFLVVFLHLISVVLFFKIGELLRDKKAALLLSGILICYSLSMDSFSAALNRVVGFPLLAFFLYYFLKENYKACFPLLFFSLILYPYVFILLCVTLLLEVLVDRDKVKWLLISRKFLLLAGGFILGGVLLGKWFMIAQNHLAGNNIQLNYKYYLKLTEVWSAHPAKNFLFHILLNIQEHTDAYKYITFYLISANFVFLVLLKEKAFDFNKKLWIFIGGTTLSFFIVLIFFDVLYASRMLLFSVPLFLAISFSLNLVKISMKFGFKFSNLRLMLSLMPFMLFLIAFFKAPLTDLKELSPVFDYLRTLPKSTLVAGHPLILDFIPLYSERNILLYANMEEKVLVAKQFKIAKKIRDIEEELFTALYADSLKEISALVDKYGITHLVIEPFYYSDKYLNSVEATKLKEIVARNNPGKRFAVLEFARKQNLLKQERVFLVSGRKLKNYNG